MRRLPSGEPSFEPPDPNWRMPDYIEVIEGWRAWAMPAKPPPFGTSPKLYSVSNGRGVHTGYWIPRREKIATCPTGCRPEYVPNPSCSCGFYAAASYDQLMHATNYHLYGQESGWIKVIGRVAQWGRVIPASEGWRAQKAYPIELYVPHEAWRLFKALKEAYGVPVRPKNILRRGA